MHIFHNIQTGSLGFSQSRILNKHIHDIVVVLYVLCLLVLCDTSFATQ